MTTESDQDDYETCIQAICDAVELLRKRKLRADEDRIQALVKQYKRWTRPYVKELIGGAAREGRICKLMYKDNFGYRTAMRISDKMAMRIIPFEPEHPSEIPEYVYTLVLDAIRLSPNGCDNIGISAGDLLEQLKLDKKLLNYNQAGLKVVLYGLQLKKSLIQLKSTLNYAIKTDENVNDAAPVPEDTIKTKPAADNNDLRMEDHIENEEHSQRPETTSERYKKRSATCEDSEIDESPYDDRLSSLSEASEASAKEDEANTNDNRDNHEQDESLEAEDADVGPEADVEPNEEGTDQDLETEGNFKKDKTEKDEEPGGEPASSEPVSSAAGRRRRVNSRYINDFYLTSSSTKGGRGVKDDYSQYIAGKRMKVSNKGNKCRDCGRIIGEIGVCLDCLFPQANSGGQHSRKGGTKRKTPAPTTEVSPVVPKSNKLARHNRAARRSAAASGPELQSSHNETKSALVGIPAKLSTDSSEGVVKEEYDCDKQQRDVDAHHYMEEDNMDSYEDDIRNRRLSHDNSSSTGEQHGSSSMQDDTKAQQKSKHNRDNLYKSFSYNNGLVTDEEQKPQIPLRFIPNRKRPEPDRSSGSSTPTASSNLNKKSSLDLDSPNDEADTATSILDLPTEQSVTTNENNHTTNGIFVPSSSSCTLDDFEPQYWTSEDVAQFISSRGFAEEARLFKEQDVDGLSLLLMQRADFLKGLSMKLGPALKIYDHIRRLKENYLPTS